MNVSNTRFIVVEGLEGAGKSTVIDALSNYLEGRGEVVFRTREPGGSPLGDMVCTLLKTTNEVLEAKTELLLLYAARLHHVNCAIKPALTKGQWVICDRFEQSSFAYQGGGRGLDVTEIKALSEWVLGGFSHGLCLLMDVEPRLGMQRARARSAPDRIESESLAFFERARQTYRSLAEIDQRTTVVDANADAQTVAQAALTVLAEYYEKYAH